MKLTKYQKEAIVRAIMNDVPQQDEMVVKKELQEAVLKAMSPAVRKLYDTHPKALCTEFVPGYTIGISYGVTIIVGDVKLDKLLEKYVKAKDEQRRVRSQLEGAVMGCNTLKQLETLLPEFKKYYPTETQPTKNLPALQNVVADLSKLGWPKK